MRKNWGCLDQVNENEKERKIISEKSKNLSDSIRKIKKKMMVFLGNNHIVIVSNLSI